MARKGGYRYGMPHKDYWRQRSRENLQEVFKTSKAAEKYLQRFYSSNLNQLLKEYRTFLKPYMNNDGEINYDLLKKDLIYNDKTRKAYTRLLERNIVEMIERSGNTTEKTLYDTLSLVYKDTSASVSSSLGVSTSLFSEAQVRAAVYRP